MTVEFKANEGNDVFLKELTIKDIVSLTVRDGAYWIEERGKQGYSFIPIALYSCHVREEDQA